MSFSGEVKKELAKQFHKSRHCQIAELAAIFTFTGQVTTKDALTLCFTTENIQVAKKCYTLLKQAFHMETEMRASDAGGGHRGHTYCIAIADEAQSRRVLQAIGVIDVNGNFCEKEQLVDGLVVLKDCCKRAFLRGAYLCAGSMSNPEKAYHFEIVCNEYEKATQLSELIHHFHIDSKVVLRKKYAVVYLKEGEQIVDMLNIMEAYRCLMNFENVRIVKEMRNSVNRQVNCETANIHKTVNAAVKQTQDIRLIMEKRGLSSLPLPLQEMARVRLEHPDAPLKELGTYFDPPIGKSGVNHRLRKLGELAESLQEEGRV